MLQFQYDRYCDSLRYSRRRRHNYTTRKRMEQVEFNIIYKSMPQDKNT